MADAGTGKIMELLEKEWTQSSGKITSQIKSGLKCPDFSRSFCFNSAISWIDKGGSLRYNNFSLLQNAIRKTIYAV
jgi:hypothetical protein